MGILKTVNDFYALTWPKPAEEIFLLVGMNTCGIAAGADKVFTILKKETEKLGLRQVKVKQVGCLGLCFCEPNVEVYVPGLPDVLYGKVDETFALRILIEHVIDRHVINENIYDKPYIDVMQLA